MANENIEVGTRAVAKVGRNEISVEVIAVENGSFLVRNDAGREFHVAHYPDATDSDSDQEHLQQAFERYGTTREIPF